MRIIPMGRLLAAAVGSLLLAHLPAVAKGVPSFTIRDVTVTESNGAVDYRCFATFRVTISNALFFPGVTYSATITTTAGTATAGNDCGGEIDFITNTKTLTFSSGQTEQTFSVLVCPDYRAEPNETFTVNLTHGSAPLAAYARAQGTIIDNDTPELRIGDVTTSEMNTNHWVTFPVTLSKASSADVVCEYAVYSRSGVDTATSGSCGGGGDYQSFTQSLTIPAGQTSRTISITVCGDMTREPDETFRILIARANGAVIQDGEAVCRILNDD